ncbi:MAG: MBOAT family protein [Firmicutes bacterium]|nr:MBOAT family protein [Bacillota bacterium]
MVFSSLLFLFAFFAPQILIYFCVKPKYRNTVLLVFSMIFYAWSGVKYLVLMMFLVGVSWFCAEGIYYAKNKGKTGKGWLIADIVMMLGVLGIFKYTGFFLQNLQWITGFPKEIPEIVLPLGISFYTFQLLSYVVDVYRGTAVVQKSYWKLLLYAGLFHQCVAGPIIRYQDVANEIEKRTITNQDLAEGIRRFSIGLAKKAILANGCAEAAKSLLPETVSAMAGVSTGGLWLGMLFYMLQIYLDFSAYSDMAIGMGRMVGFHYLENFNYPYTAVSVQDFWRRWHISLSSFFRDYVYIPLGGSRVRKSLWVRNMFVVWFLTGLWHGASWNYIFWGLYFLVFLLAERPLLKKKIPAVIRHLVTLLIVYFGWVLFKFEDMSLLGSVFKGLFGIGITARGVNVMTTLVNYLFFLIAAFIACTPLLKNLRAKIVQNDAIRGSLVWRIVEIAIPTVLLLLSVCALVGNSYNPFLYFQF